MPVDYMRTVRISLILIGLVGLSVSAIITLFSWFSLSGETIFYFVLSWIFFFIFSLGYEGENQIQSPNQKETGP